MFCGGFWSVSGDGRNFRCCTVGESLRDCDLVSVIAVQEKCDEKKGEGRIRKWSIGCLQIAACGCGDLREGVGISSLHSLAQILRDKGCRDAKDETDERKYQAVLVSDKE